MNLLLLGPGDFLPDGTARVSGRRFKQLEEVIKAAPGKLCKAGVMGGPVGSAELLAMEADHADLRFEAHGAPPPPLKVILCCALPRPLTFSKVIHSAVTCGVKRICFFHSAKVEKSYWQSSRLADEFIREEVTLALEQCADTVFPEISFHRKFRKFVEDELPVILPEKTLRIFGSPGAEAPVPAGAAHNGEVALVIGPEGGLNEFEEQDLRDHGFAGVTLGSRILRSEFAVNAFLSVLGVVKPL